MYELLAVLDLLFFFVLEEGGATAVEYALIATFISISAIIAMQALGVSMQEMFVRVASAIDFGVAKSGL